MFEKDHFPWNKNPVTKICLNCNNYFEISKSRNKDGRGKFCCLQCRSNYKFKLSKQFVIDSNLAELIGIIIGDGCINKCWNRKDYRIQISGNPVEDKDYYEYYLPKLLFDCLKIKRKPYLGSNGAYIIQFQSEPFRLFLKDLEIFSPKAKIVRIPNIIKEDEILLKSCIKGIFDSDFTIIFNKRKKNGLHYYPRITACFASKNLVKDLEFSLRKFNFTLNCKYDVFINDPRCFSYITNFINLDGPHNLERWMSLIGSSNSRILTKYFVWKKQGHLEPKSTLEDRKKILMG